MVRHQGSRSLFGSGGSRTRCRAGFGDHGLEYPRRQRRSQVPAGRQQPRFWPQCGEGLVEPPHCLRPPRGRDPVKLHRDEEEPPLACGGGPPACRAGIVSEPEVFPRNADEGGGRQGPGATPDRIKCFSSCLRSAGMYLESVWGLPWVSCRGFAGLYRRSKGVADMAREFPIRTRISRPGWRSRAWRVGGQLMDTSALLGRSVRRPASVLSVSACHARPFLYRPGTPEYRRKPRCRSCGRTREAADARRAGKCPAGTCPDAGLAVPR